MKKQLLLLTFCFFLSISFAQNDEPSSSEEIISEILKEKPKEYFELTRLANKLPKRSLESLKKLNSESEKSGYKLGQIFSLHFIGLYYRNTSDYDLAIKTLEEAIEIAEEEKDKSSKVVLFNTIGSTYRRRNDIKNAITYHQYALSEAAKIKDPSLENKRSISIAENSIGNIYLLLKQYDLALEKFDKALKTQKNLDDLNGLALNYQNIGFAYEKIGDIDRALENYQTSLDYNIKNNSSFGIIICNNSISSVLIEKKKYEEALTISKENYNLVKDHKDKKLYSSTISKLGLAQLKTGNLEEAKKTLLESVNLSKKYNYSQDYINSSFYLSELYAKEGDNEKAFSYYKEAVETDNKISGEQNLLFVSNLVNKHNTQIKIDQLRSLEDQVKIRTFEFSRSRNVLIITLVSLALLSVALYSIYRQRLLNNDRRVLLLEQQALQAQMNPHFIFNALNSIKLYIINNDQKQAVYYLNKFSKLIRNILDVSKIKEVSLKEELKTMDLYMSIENIRFNNEISYSQKINSDLNLDTIKVPPLVLQPFLENAIWHGLSSKNGDKEVVLSAFKVSKNLIEISISDNGVGRKAAMEIKKNKNRSLKRKSIGIDLTVERLKTFANDFMHDFSLKYYDLKDKEGNPKGTKVVLRIPLR